VTDKKSNDSRRKLLKSIAAGSGAVVAGKSLPESWSKPVINSVMLPAHAETTDGSGSAGGDATTTPAPISYFDTDLDFLVTQRETGAMEKPRLLANIANVLVPEVHASPTGIGGMSVVVAGGSASVRFLSTGSRKLYIVTAPLDGTASGVPTLEQLGAFCKPPRPTGGPASGQLINYTPGDPNVQVRVNAADNPGWEVLVPKKPVGLLVVQNCDN